MNNLACAILAGGRGSRLFPLTFKKAKPAVLFGPGYRLIDIPISNALNAKITDICIFTQYYPELLESYIQDSFSQKRIDPAKIEVFRPPVGSFGETQLFQGTADAMRKLKHYIASKEQEYILILSGDQLYTMDFAPFFEDAKNKQADLMIACLKVNQKEAMRMGVMKINDEAQIIDFYEKPKKEQDLKRLALEGETYLASMGIYIFKKQALLALLEENGDDFGKDLIPIQLKKGQVYAYQFSGYWEDIGTVDSFYKANLALISQEPSLEMTSETHPIYSKVHHLQSPVIKECTIESSLLAQGTVIKADKISKSIIGLGAKLDEGSQITGSIILSSCDKDKQTSIGKFSILKNVIVDEGVTIGNNVKLENFNHHQNFDGPGIFIRDGITIVQAGTQIPDGYEL